MTNKEALMDQLLDSSPTPTVSSSDGEQEVSISLARVVNIRYRIYVLILIVFLAIFGVNYVLPTYDQFNLTHNRLNQTQNQIDSFETRKQQYLDNSELIKQIEFQENTVIDCLNKRSFCNQVDPMIKDQFGVARTYIQLNDLATEKMAVDERILLANINDYLLSVDINKSQSRSKNGNINRISIGDSTPYFENLYVVPIDLNITFKNKDGLLSFVENVEQKVVPKAKDRVFYKIEEVGYDIVSYDYTQDVDITMKAYYLN